MTDTNGWSDDKIKLHEETSKIADEIKEVLIRQRKKGATEIAQLMALQGLLFAILATQDKSLQHHVVSTFEAIFKEGCQEIKAKETEITKEI